jgi:hypothetical protein
VKGRGLNEAGRLPRARKCGCGARRGRGLRAERAVPGARGWRAWGEHVAAVGGGAPGAGRGGRTRRYGGGRQEGQEGERSRARPVGRIGGRPESRGVRSGRGSRGAGRRWQTGARARGGWGAQGELRDNGQVG